MNVPFRWLIFSHGRNHRVARSYPSVGHWTGDAREGALTSDVVRYILFQYAVTNLEEVSEYYSSGKGLPENKGGFPLDAPCDSFLYMYSIYDNTSDMEEQCLIHFVFC